MPQSFREHDRETIQREFGKTIARHVSREAIELSVATGNIDYSCCRGFFQIRQESLHHFERSERVCLERTHHLLTRNGENRYGFVRINSCVVDQHVELAD